MRILAYCMCFVISVTGLSQQADTTYLKEVSIYSPPVTQYATGSKIEKINMDDQVNNLANALLGETSLYMKNYGNGQLSSIAMRGTTASQTAVLWNGININSPTLGQTDFSLIPLFLFDEAVVQYGTASSLYGSDAMGGSILLNQSIPDFRKTSRFLLSQQVGSFGRTSTGLKASFGQTRWQFKTKLYRSFIENNFPYLSPAVGYRKTQNHASVENYGGDQQIYYRISQHQLVTGEAMFTYNFRENQPVVTTNAANETLLDRHLRTSISYHHDLAFGILKATAAYIASSQDYSDDNTSTVKSRQASMLINMDQSLSTRANLRWGVNTNYYTALAKEFNNVKDIRIDVFTSYRYALREWWIVNVNLRQSLYNKRYAPFSPTLGTEAHLLNRTSQKIKARAQLARGFRIPTLNDRYWQPGGNPLIKPENGLHSEGGLEWLSSTSKLHTELNTTYYQSWLRQMIVWLPDDQGLWTPINLQAVDIKGVEASLKFRWKMNQFISQAGVSYSYTQSVNQRGLNAFDQSTVHKQLPYVPLHNAKAFFAGELHRWKINIDYNYTGARYSTLDNSSYGILPAYALLNAGLTKKFVFPAWAMQIQAESNNILNVYYENMKNHAMSGRNYLISIIISNTH